MQGKNIPKHIAVIMDGNGRWASRRHLPRFAGHLRGIEALRKTVKACAKKGVSYLTVFAFSSENWRRPAEEVSFLSELFLSALESEVNKLHDNGVRLKIVGDLSRFGDALQNAAAKAEEKTAGNSRLTLTICANYGGRWDILQAAKKMISENKDLSGFSEEDLSKYTALSYAPDPDLFIRTGGEQRISNFLLWQMAYTEMYFTDKFWPDFDENVLEEAIASFQQRERRFGRTSEQLKE